MSSSDFPLKPLLKRNDLFLPNLDINISKALPTALTLFKHKIPQNRTLIPYLVEKEGWRKLQESEITKVMFLIIDSLGFNQFANYSRKMKSKFNDFGLILSSVFPTITSACMASLRFGTMPIKHGLLGHKIQFTEIDNVVDTLTLKTKTSLVDLPTLGINVKNWLWSNSPVDHNPSIIPIGLYESHIANSGLSNLIYQKSCSIGHYSHVDCFTAAQKILEKDLNKNLFLDVYIDSIDAIAHRYSTEHQAFEDEVNNIEQILFRMLNRLKPKIAEQTAILVVADHGQENLFAEKRVIIEASEEEKLIQMIKNHGRSGRVIHIYSKEGKQEDVVNWFENKLNGKGIILTPKDYPKVMGIGADNKKVIERMGDVQVVLGENSSLFFGHSGEFDQVFNLGLNATHGSLSKAELIVPFLIGKASDLKTTEN